jgi:MFS transporter, DHA2 family, multidrug resistance protein
MQKSLHHEAGPKATRRDWIGLAVITLPCLLYSMDLMVLNLAVPHLIEDLKPSAVQLLWIIDIYGFFVAGSLITMGTLGDRIGRRKVLLIGATAFGLTSLIAAFSTSAEMLIVARGLLGVAAATLAPSTLSLIRNMFLDPRERTMAIGMWIASYSAGGVVGPLIGGVMLEHFWWGSVFLINVPVMVLLLILGPLLLPEFRDEKAGRIDLVSAALSLAAVLAVIWGLKRAAVYGFGAEPMLAILGGLVLGAIFVKKQQGMTDPLIDVSLFRVPAVSASLAINVLGLFAIFGSFVFVAQYLQLVEGFGPLEAGLWTVPSGLAFVVGSLITPGLARRYRPSLLICGAFAFAAIGFAMMAAVPLGFWMIIAGSVLLSVAFSPVATLTTDLVMAATPPQRAGAASAISETSFEFGAAVGIAVLGSLFAALYQSAMGSAPLPGIAPEALAAARDTLGGALEAAKTLPQPAATDVVEAARTAFVGAFTVTAVICAAIAFATALFASRMLRGPHDLSAAEREAESAG